MAEPTKATRIGRRDSRLPLERGYLEDEMDIDGYFEEWL